jgi:hypothetical protein
MDQDLKNSLSASDTWIRGAYILLFCIIYSVAEAVLFLIVIFQFVVLLLTSETNERVHEFSDDLTLYLYRVLQYLTFTIDQKPFPFSPWPDGTEDLAESPADTFEPTEPEPENPDDPTGDPRL